MSDIRDRINEELGFGSSVGNKKPTDYGSERKRRKRRTQTDPSKELADNQVHLVLSDPELGGQEKVETVVSQCVFGEEGADSMVRDLRDYQGLFQDLIKTSSEEIIDEVNEDTMAELKNAVVGVEVELSSVNQAIEPILAVTRALTRLRREDETGNTTARLLKEIIEEGDRYQEYERTCQLLRQKISSSRRLEEEYRAGVNFFERIFGGTNTRYAESYRIEAERAEAELADYTENVSFETQFPEYSEIKDQLRLLVDSSSEEHTSRHKEIISIARQAVENAENTMCTAIDRIDNQYNAVKKMTDQLFEHSAAYAVLHDIVEKVLKRNQPILGELESLPEENSTQMVAKNRKMRSFQEFMNMISTLHESTVLSMSDLEESMTRNQSIQDGLMRQREEAVRIRNTGPAKIANIVSSTLMAVSSAALTEKNAGVKSILGRMSDDSRVLVGEQMMTNALMIADRSSEIQKSVAVLEDLSEKTERANSISAEALHDIQQNLRDLEEVTVGVQNRLAHSDALHQLTYQSD